MFQDSTRVTEVTDDDVEIKVANQNEKVSDLIRRTIKHYDKLDGNKFKFTSNFFISIRQNTNNCSTVCFTCLAGSLFSHIREKRSRLKYINYGGGIYTWNLMENMFYEENRSHKEIKNEVSKETFRDMIILERVRYGYISEAIAYSEIFPNSGHSLKKFYYSLPIEKLLHDNQEFKGHTFLIEWDSKKEWVNKARKEFLHRADLLEEAGH